MASKQERAEQLAVQFAALVAQEFYGEEGPALDCDIDEIEDIAVLAAKAAFDATIARALALQNQRLPEQLPCPDCQQLCQVRREARTIQGRLGSAKISEPFCHCPACQRDFFPSTGNTAAG